METGMKIGRCLIACGVALVTAGTVPLEVYASSPEFARSEKEWARLQDDVLEYDEIEALIAEYNATVQTNQLDLNEFKKKYGNTKDDISAKYRDMAECRVSGCGRSYLWLCGGVCSDGRGAGKELDAAGR